MKNKSTIQQQINQSLGVSGNFWVQANAQISVERKFGNQRLLWLSATEFLWLVAAYQPKIVIYAGSIEVNPQGFVKLNIPQL